MAAFVPADPRQIMKIPGGRSYASRARQLIG
jgi:hypothetical protein